MAALQLFKRRSVTRRRSRLFSEFPAYHVPTPSTAFSHHTRWLPGALMRLPMTGSGESLHNRSCDAPCSGSTTEAAAFCCCMTSTRQPRWRYRACLRNSRSKAIRSCTWYRRVTCQNRCLNYPLLPPRPTALGRAYSIPIAMQRAAGMRLRFRTGSRNALSVRLIRIGLTNMRRVM